jgi:hypothetical protein
VEKLTGPVLAGRKGMPVAIHLRPMEGQKEREEQVLAGALDLKTSPK